MDEEPEEMPPPDAETVQVIPGSDLIWKITPRPENSSQVREDWREWRPVFTSDKEKSGIIASYFVTLKFCSNFILSLWQFYAFSTFAMHLNELEKSMEGVISPTDSRLRPDIRAMEKGDTGTVSDLDFSPYYATPV